MQLALSAALDYNLGDPVDLLLQIEAAEMPDQRITGAATDVGDVAQFARIAGDDGIGTRIWLRSEGMLKVHYQATVDIDRPPVDYRRVEQVPMHRLPAAVVPYLNESRYCSANKFLGFVQAEFGDVRGGERIGRMRDWIQRSFTYVHGVSDTDSGADDSFIARCGVCRDYAHVLISLARASAIPARMVSVYALGLEPQDFHAVAEVYLDGAWHLVDATGMAKGQEMAIIGVGRDAADISFLTAYGKIELVRQKVRVATAF